ncbi:MAG TPA: GAF domain-containing sensor histidine kinase [Actinomycetes bacterium]|nr:GAF domain-containing sensor histidine kinase [Actinomycetes bacterium]
MDDPARDPAAFAAMSDAVLSIAAELSLEPVLAELVEAARRLAGAGYAAIGIPDEHGDGFARFITAGMSDELIEAIGPLPRRHGLLGAMLADPAPYRTEDVTADPRFGWWPPAHPRMRSFLGVPIVSKGDVVGAVYLTEKQGAPGFSEADQGRIELLAAHAAIAIEHARLYELSRELSVAEERNRLARELHDSMNQTLFSLVLTAEVAAAAVRTDPSLAETQLKIVKELARSTMAELRAVIQGLRPPALEADGLAETLRKHVDVLRRVHRADIRLQVHGERRLQADRERELFRIAQEALHNALRHADAETVGVELTIGQAVVRVVVSDDGKGFDPAARGLRARRLGLTTMRERARALGGSLQIRSAPGAGTTVRVEVPGG